MTLTPKDKVYLNAAWAIVIGFTILRIFYSGLYLLVPDEANYWQWGRHLAWGYHDNSPMIGWAIRLATEVFGQTERAVRLPSVLSMAIASAYMVAIAGRWFESRTAFYTALLTQSILEFNVGALLATTDALQAAGWAGAAFHVLKAYDRNTLPDWLISGFWFGFGMLSKFTMIIFLPGAYLFGLLLTQYRGRLSGIKPYAGLALGFMMFFPVILWNAENGWNSVRHVAHLGGANQGFSIHFKYLGEYLASQAGLLSPVVFFLILYAWYYAVTNIKRNPVYLYLFLTSFIMISGFAVLSLHTRIYGNWPGAGYITASVLAAALFTAKEESIPGLYKKAWPWGIVTSYILTGILLLHTAIPVLPISTELDRVAKEVSGWDVLGKKVDETIKRMPNPAKTFIFGIRYQIASELAFYTPGQPRTVSINKWRRPNVYDYWWKDEDLLGFDGVGVSREANLHKTKLKTVFERVSPPVEIKVFRDLFWNGDRKEPAMKLYIYRAYGFKGGLKWIPPDSRDIRADS